MNKIFYVLGAVIAGVGIYFLFSPSQTVNNPLKINPTYEKEKKKSNFESENKFQNTPEIKTAVKTVHKKPVREKNINNTSQKIADFIGNHDLISVQQVGNVEVFASNPPSQDELAPPAPPTLIKLNFKDKSKIIPLDSKLINSNTKIYAVEKNGDKYSGIKEIDTKKLTSFTPPLIGQN